jgi:hypothetical protein
VQVQMVTFVQRKGSNYVGMKISDFIKYGWNDLAQMWDDCSRKIRSMYMKHAHIWNCSPHYYKLSSQAAEATWNGLSLLAKSTILVCLVFWTLGYSTSHIAASTCCPCHCH